VLWSVEHCMLSWSELAKIYKNECKGQNRRLLRELKLWNQIWSQEIHIAAIMLMSCNQYFRLHSFQAVSISIDYMKSITSFLCYSIAMLRCCMLNCWLRTALQFVWVVTTVLRHLVFDVYSKPLVKVVNWRIMLDS